jgi:hypothetical protein
MLTDWLAKQQQQQQTQNKLTRACVRMVHKVR